MQDFYNPVPLEKYEGMLADIRDMFPVPAPGSELESAWAGATACPEYVPAYVKDSIAAMSLDTANILRASRYSADLTMQALETVASLQAARCAYANEFPLNVEGEPDIGSIHANIRTMKAENAALKEKNRALTLELLKVLAHVMRDVCNKFAAVLPQPANHERQTAPNDAWCVGCNPDNCSGCGTVGDRWTTTV